MIVLICELVKIILFGDWVFESFLKILLILLNFVLSLNEDIFVLIVSCVFIYFFVYKSFVMLLFVDVLYWVSYLI